MYKLKVCSVCGSAELVELGGELKNGEMFGVYECPCCDSILYAHAKYLREQKANSKALLKAISGMAKAESESAKKEDNTVTSSKSSNPITPAVPIRGTAQDVYKLTRGGAIKMSVDFGEREIRPDGITKRSFAGTGTMISNEYFITNAHVVVSEDKVAGTEKLPIDIDCVADDKKYLFGADLICYDTKFDLALLKVDAVSDKLVPVKFRETEVEVGEPVFVVGNSRGQGICILEGIVSDNHRMIDGFDHIMITAAVTHGNSGGPVYDGNGELIGVVVSGYDDIPNMNYVIPVHIIKPFLKDVKSHGVIDLDF